MRLGGRAFSGEFRLAEIHNSVGAASVSEFLPVDRTDRRFIEALLWIFHFCGLCCAVVGIALHVCIYIFMYIHIYVYLFIYYIVI
jgi:hypothetical protein